jgi:predicted porin
MSIPEGGAKPRYATACAVAILVLAASTTFARAQGAGPANGPTDAPQKVALKPQASSNWLDHLTFHGVTLYGTVDMGLAYLSHGAPLSAYYGPGLPFLVQKFSNRPITSVAGNGLSQSKIGLVGAERLGRGVDFVFRLESGFNPTSLQLVDGPRSLIKSNGKALTAQDNSGDSARAGQPFNGAAYLGLSSKTFGTLTYGRQNSLILDDLIKYDPQAQSQAFSPIGYSGVAGGGGATEDTRLDDTVKYVVAHGPVRLGLAHQFGSGGKLPGGADQADVGADLQGLSVDAVYAHVVDAVAASPLSAAQNLVHPGALAATVSDTTTWSVQARYGIGPAKLYGGWEHIEYANPSTPVLAPARTLGGYELSYVNNTAYTHHKILQISWVGLRYAVTRRLEVTGAYYRYDQNSYKGDGCSNASASSCSGQLSAMSLVADYHLTKHFDTYLGVTTSRVSDGLASGYLKSSVVAPMGGARLSF